MDRETARRKSAELEAAVNKAYSDVTAGKITDAEFNRVCDNANKEVERIDVAYKSRQYANKFNIGPDEMRGGLAGPVEGVRCKGAAPKLAFGQATMKAAFDAATSGQNFQVSTKDTLGFNSSVEPLLPPELAAYIVRWQHEWRILDRIPVMGVTAPSFEIIRHASTTGAADIVAEGQQKPEIVLNMDHITLPMLKVAAHSATSWELIADWDLFQNYLGSELPLQLYQKENQQLLYGSGDGEWAGFFTTGSILQHDCSGSTGTDYLDDIEESVEQLRSGAALAEPDLFITSPSSWSALRRVKDDLHRYILAADPSKDEVNTLWGIPVLVTTACNPGDGLLIDSNKFGRALVRESLVMRQGYSDDDFRRNLIRWVCEIRGNLAVERPAAVLQLSNLPTTVNTWSS